MIQSEDMRDTFFITIFFALLAVAVIHISGNIFFLYFKIWWLDAINHFLGGFWVGGIILWGYKYLFPFFLKNTSRVWVVALAVFGTLIIGLWWEIYEVLIGSVILPSEEYFSDTISDLLLDMTGALCATCYFLYIKRLENNA